MELFRLRTYIMVGLGVGLIFFALGTFFGIDIANFFNQFRWQAIAVGLSPAIANVIVDPLIWIMLNPLYGAIGAALLWPLVFVWAFFCLFLLVYTLIGGGFNIAVDAVSY